MLAKKWLIVILLPLVFLTACQGQQDKGKENQTQIQSEKKIEQIGGQAAEAQWIADEAKKALIKMEEVTSVKAVKAKQKLLVALEVRQRNKFQLQQLKKEAQKTLKKMYPHMEIVVSTDPKTYIELNKLEQKLKKDKLNKKQIKKKLKKIEKLEKDRY